MKKMWMLILVAAVVMVSAGLYGCSKKDTGKKPVETKVEGTKPADTEAVKSELEDAKPIEHPAAEKPKDHPAH